jgi:hypothetical protein
MPKRRQIMAWFLIYRYQIYIGTSIVPKKVPLEIDDFSKREEVRQTAKKIFEENPNKEYRTGNENPQLVWEENL